MTAPPDIFLSYNREDQAIARRFAEAFEGEGFSVWWDTTLRAGEAYDEVTETALRTAKAVVVLWSPRSVVSRWVRAEATLADRNKTLVPCMIEPCERPIMFELTQTTELSHWNGAVDDQAWRAFTADVRRLIGRAVAPPPVMVASEPPPSPRGERGDRPSLAIMPFTNRSGLPEDDVFAFGMVEDVIDALSQGVNVRVLASSATAGYLKDAITDLPTVGRQLGVRYLLEGNVRRVGEVLRVTAQLVEAATSTILWTRRFERPLPELAALQEELVLEVAAHLDTQVLRLEMERALRKPDDLTAWEAVTRSMATFRRLGTNDLSVGLAEAKYAVEIAPDYGAAHAILSLQIALNYFIFAAEGVDPTDRVRAHISQAMALDPDNAVTLGFVAQALNMIGRPEEALPRAERAIRLSPSYGYAHLGAALSCILMGRLDEADAHLDADLRAAPGSHMAYINYYYRAHALIRRADWDGAIEAFDRSIALNPEPSFAYMGRAITMGMQGRRAEATPIMAAARRIEPDRTLGDWEIRWRRFLSGSSGQDPFVECMSELWTETEQTA